MKILGPLLCTCLLASSTSAVPQGPSGMAWSVQDVAPTTCDNRAPALQLGPSGALHVLYYYDNLSGGRGEMRYTALPPFGGAWAPPLFVADNAFQGPSVDLGPGEVPFCAYSEGSDETERMRNLVAGVFTDFGPPLPSGDFWKGGMGGCVTVNSQGIPGLAYFYGPDEDAYYSEWNGSGWTTVAVETSGRVGKGMVCCLTDDDRPMLAYYHQDLDEVHFAERGSNGLWTVDSTTFPFETPLDLECRPNGDVCLLVRTNDQGDVHLLERIAGTWTEDFSFPGQAYTGGEFFVDAGGSIHAVVTDGQGQVDYLRETSNVWFVDNVAMGNSGGRGADIAVTMDGSPLIAFTRIWDDELVLATGTLQSPVVYCTAKTSSAGCLTAISTSDPATQPVSGANDYSVTASQVQELKNGLLIVGISGPANIPFNGGVLCVQPFTKRGPIKSSGGSDPSGCNGAFSTLVNDGNLIPSGLDAGPGNTGWYQYWYRDPLNGSGQFGTALSDAVRLDFQ